MVKITRSTVIDAPLTEVWEVLRDFNSHDQWHQIVRASRIEDGRASDEVGAIRDFQLAAGGAIREQLLSLSDRDHSLTYCILDAPIPLIGYVATVRLKPVTDGNRTFWHWSCSFDTPPEREVEMARLVATEVYEGGFAGLRRLISGEGGGGRVTEMAVHRPSEDRASGPARDERGGGLDADGIVVAAYGGPETMRMGRTPAPAPGPGEVRLRHTAIGVNFIDVYCRTGYFPLLSLPGTPGMEAAGVVTEVGAGVGNLFPGDRVGYACPPVGAYATHRTMRSDLLTPLPADIDDRTAAAGLLKGMTAEFLLHTVHQVRDGDTILVHAAAGGVGQLICQWARALGATVIGTVGSGEKARIARDAGCAHPIVYTEEDFVARVAEITRGKGVAVAYDAVGRDTLPRSFEALGVHGHLVSYGQASGHIAAIDIAAYASKSATITRPNFGHYTDTPEKVRRITDALFRAIRSGIIRIAPPTVFPLGHAAAAHRLLESRQSTGSIILVP